MPLSTGLAMCQKVIQRFFSMHAVVMRIFLASIVSLLCAITGPTALAEGPTMTLGGLFFGDF